MNFIKRIAERFIIALLVIGALWLIGAQIFNRLEDRLPLFWAILGTYVAAAYFILPQIVRLGMAIIYKERIPSTVHAADGLPADPINITLVGTEAEINYAFARAGWHTAEALTVATTIKMGIAFILKRPYPTAPFSSLYLFGRKQDLAFQQAIGNSPRARHHIRLWKKENNIWLGAAVKDTGFGLARLTYQITHRIDRNIDHEREYILEALRNTKLVKKDEYITSEQMAVGKYKTDGKILMITLDTPQ